MPGEITVTSSSPQSSPIYNKNNNNEFTLQNYSINNHVTVEDDILTSTVANVPVVPKSLSAHDCLIGVTQEHLSSPTSNNGFVADRRHATASSSSATAPTKPRGWYATRKAYRSVAYKTWTVGGARKLLNGNLAAPDKTFPSPTTALTVVDNEKSTPLDGNAPTLRCLSSSPVGPSSSFVRDGSVSDSDEKYYSAMEESDFDECTVPGCMSAAKVVGRLPRKCLSTEIFYQASSSSIPNGSVNVINTNHNNNNNIVNDNNNVGGPTSDRTNVIRFLCTEPSTSTLACSRSSSINNNNGLDGSAYSSSTIDGYYGRKTPNNNNGSDAHHHHHHHNHLRSQLSVDNNGGGGVGQQRRRNIRRPDDPTGCSDQEDLPTDCFSSEDYCRYQKRNGTVVNGRIGCYHYITDSQSMKRATRPPPFVVGQRNHRLARSFDAIDYEPRQDADDGLDEEICINLDDDDGGGAATSSGRRSSYEQELRTVIDTFQDLKNLRKKQMLNNRKLPLSPSSRSKSPSSTSQTLIRKLQQVLPKNLHITSGNNHNGKQISSLNGRRHDIVMDLLGNHHPSIDNRYQQNGDNSNTYNDDNVIMIDKGDCYRQAPTDVVDIDCSNSYSLNMPKNNEEDCDRGCCDQEPNFADDNNDIPDAAEEFNNDFINYANLSFANSGEALGYLRNEFITIREKDFMILKQLQQVEHEIQAQKMQPNKNGFASNVSAIDVTVPQLPDGRLLIPVPKCLSARNLL